MSFICFCASYFQIQSSFAWTYYGTWWMGADVESESPGNARIIYTYPDSVQSGKPFTVGVTLEYLKDKSARSSWVVFSNVSINLRSLPVLPGEPNMHNLLANTTHETCGLIRPGEQYSQSINLTAPTSGKYMLALTFDAIFGPGAGAVGIFQFDTGTYYNQTNKEHGIILPVGFQEAPPIIVENTNRNQAEHKLKVEGRGERRSEITPLNLTVDGKPYPVVNRMRTFSLPINSSHTIEVPELINLVKDTDQPNYVVRAVFVKWSDGVDNNIRTISMDRNVELFARYRIQYFLSVGSTLGNITIYDGSKCYDGGDEARFSVNPSLGFFSVHSFDRWIGDIPNANIGPLGDTIMNGPKEVTAIWKFDFGYLGAIIGIVTGALTLYGRINHVSLRIFNSTFQYDATVFDLEKK